MISVGRPFHFRQFSIVQEASAMKVGTDGVLLGAMAAHTSPKRILDVGCGTGIIGLMLAQRYPEARVDLVEKDELSCTEAHLNAQNSPFSERTHVHHEDFRNFESSDQFDLIVSNPPYHLEAIVSSNTRRARSRSVQGLEPEDLITKAMDLLAEDGRFWLISPVAYFERCVSLELPQLVHQINIYPKQSKPVNRVVSCWSNQLSVPKVENFILRDEDNDYSEVYKKLTRDFHPQY